MRGNRIRTLVPLAGCLAVLFAWGRAARADAVGYCPPTPNSVGAGVLLEWSGRFDPAEGSLVATGLPPGAPTAFVYGFQTQAAPFGAGRLCVLPAFILARRAADPQGRIQLAVDQGEQEDVRWLVSGLLPGAKFQALYRDAGAGYALNTSGALDVVFEF